MTGWSCSGAELRVSNKDAAVTALVDTERLAECTHKH